MEIIIGIVVLIAFLLILTVIGHNKFQFSIIKIEEAENNIDVLLHKKLDLLDRAIPIIKKELKLEVFLEDLEKIKDNKISLFELNTLLKNNSNDFFKILDDNEKLFKSETLSTIIDDISTNEIELTAAIKFYNDAVVVFNKLISSFPSNILAFIKRYKKKEFYSNEKKEIFEILNN